MKYRMTADEFLKAFPDQATETSRTKLSALYGAAGAVPEPAKLSKYRSVKVEIDGRVFDSKKEANRYLDLRAEMMAKSITELRCQVPFPLVVNGVTVCVYVADFVYVRDGATVIEDVKSRFTRKLAVYRIKVKFMAALGFIVSEV